MIAAERRLAKVTASLSPREAVLAWLAEAQQYSSLVDYTRSIVDLPEAAAPLSRITDEVRSAVRTSMKGEPRETVEPAVRRAVGDAVFLFALIFRINGAALEIAQRHSLVALVLIFWMGTYAHDSDPGDGELREPEAELAEEFQGTWRQWRAVFDIVAAAVQVEREARETLERQYFEGHSVLFADAAKEWADLEDLVERLAELAELWPPLRRSGVSARRASRQSGRQVTESAQARTKVVADDARVTAFELLGERPRAAAIMARRLRSEAESGLLSTAVSETREVDAP